VVHTQVQNNRNTNKECLLTWSSSWGHASCTCSTKSQVGKYQLIESDTVHIHVGALSRLCLHTRIVLMFTYTCGHNCAKVEISTHHQTHTS
jgi:hypothetical protein